MPVLARGVKPFLLILTGVWLAGRLFCSQTEGYRKERKGEPQFKTTWHTGTHRRHSHPQAPQSSRQPRLGERRIGLRRRDRSVPSPAEH